MESRLIAAVGQAVSPGVFKYFTASKLDFIQFRLRPKRLSMGIPPDALEFLAVGAKTSTA